MIINFSNTNGGGGGDITVDSQMSDTSTNAVQNKVIKEYVDQHSGGISQLTVNPKQMFESFDVYLNLIDGKFHWNGFDNSEIVDAEHEYYLYNTYLPDSLDNKNFNLSYYPEGTVLTPIYPVSIKDTDGKVYYAYNPNISVQKGGNDKECIFAYKVNDFVCELHLVRDGDSQHLKDAYLVKKVENKADKQMIWLNDDWSGDEYYDQRKELFDSLSAWTETHEVGKEEIPFTVVWGHDFAKEIGETSYVKPIAVTTRAGVRQDFMFITDTKVIIVYINDRYEWEKLEAEYRQW